MSLVDRSNPIQITVPGCADDPRDRVEPIPGILVHYSAPLHPDDLAVVRGIPCTSLARTLIDCAESMAKEELRQCFAEVRRKGMLDMDAVRASRARVEWRPSLAMLDEVIAEFTV